MYLGWTWRAGPRYICFFTALKPPLLPQDLKCVLESLSPLYHPHCYREPNYILQYIPWVVLVCSAMYPPNCSRSHEITTILNEKNTFLHFSKSILVIPTKLGRDIPWSKELLVHEYDLNGPWPQEMAAILKVKMCNFCTFPEPKKDMQLFFMVSGEFFSDFLI